MNYLSERELEEPLLLPTSLDESEDLWLELLLPLELRFKPELLEELPLFLDDDEDDESFILDLFDLSLLLLLPIEPPC